MEALHLTITNESAERISLLYGVAKEHGSLVTVGELLQLLPEAATEDELAKAIASTPSLSSRFELRSGYVTEKSGPAEGDLAVAEELRNRRSARENLLWASRFVPHLHSTPFSMVAASGSTSYRSASRSKDLDLFCIAPSGGLWTALTRGLLLARAYGVLHPDSPEICFSCVMDEGFAAALFRREQGPLFARDALETIVLRGGSTYRSLLSEAGWISSLYPNAYWSKVGDASDAHPPARRPSALSRVVEGVLCLLVSRYVRAKSRMLNGRLAKSGRFDSVFAVLSGRDHLIYESSRYSRLKLRYSTGFVQGARATGAEGDPPARGVRAASMESLHDRPPREGSRIADGILSAAPPGTSTEFIRLTTRGRTTGIPHIVQLRYTWSEGSFHVIAGSAESDWVLNATSRRDGVVRLGETLYEVTAELTDGGGMSRTLAEFRSKYGGALVKRWYSKAEAALRLTPVAPPKRRGSLSGEFEAKSTLADWRRGRTNYYGDVAAAFDSASEEYDFTIGHNFINTWIRKRSIEALLQRVRQDDFLLEVGAGTGAEAIEIAKHVRGLVAIDVSQSMVDLLAAKVRARHLEGKVFPVKLAASELPCLRGLLAGRSVRVAYSFNGALNCEPRINEFVAGLAELLEPGGVFICSVRNTLCLTEVLSHAAVLQFDRMNPRKRQPIMVSVGGRDIPSTYYPPEEFVRKFKPHFEAEKVIALPGLLPPAYLSNYYLRLGRLTSVIERLDRALSGLFPLNRYGDQTLFIFRKPA